MPNKKNHNKYFPTLEQKADKEMKRDLEIVKESVDKRKYAFLNPLGSKVSPTARMYFNTNLEKIARIAIVVSRMLIVILFGIFLFKVFDMLKNLHFISSFFQGNDKPIKWILGLMIFFSFLLTISYVVPMLIVRTSGTMFKTSIAIMFKSIISFFFQGILLVGAVGIHAIGTMLIPDTPKDVQLSPLIPVVGIFNLIFTLVTIVSACLLLVKSDDIKRKISVE